MNLEILSHRAPWFVAGPAIGLLIVGLMWMLNKPLGALGAYIEVEEWAIGKRRSAGWRTFFIVGVAIGGVLSTVTSTGWHPTLQYGSFDAMIGGSMAMKAAALLIAGTLMGAGGRLAGGCTSGHGLCGTAFGSPASLASTATFMAIAIATMFAITWLAGA